MVSQKEGFLNMQQQSLDAKAERLKEEERLLEARAEKLKEQEGRAAQVVGEYMAPVAKKRQKGKSI